MHDGGTKQQSTPVLSSHVCGGVQDPESAVLIDCFNPATTAPVARLAEASAVTVGAAVTSARKAFDDGQWCRETPQFRAACLRRLADAIENAADELGRLDMEDMGKPLALAVDEARESADMIRADAGRAAGLAGKVFASHRDVNAYAIPEPLGVVAAITPWNYPMPNLAHKVGPALAAGNCVLLKPSEISSRSALKVAELAAEAGFPDGVLQVLVGRGETTGQALAGHMDVDMISFTGSTATGGSIMASAGRSNLKRLMLECGGKSPQIIFPDIPVTEELARHALATAFANSGQLCVAKTRLLVHVDIADRLTEAMADCLSGFEPGDPSDPATRFGPIAFERQFRRVNELIESGVQQGASPSRPATQRKPEGKGWFVPPVVFTQVTPGMRISREEIFGPVLAVTTFDSDDEALRLANDSPYGLSASLWTRDAQRVHRFSRELRVGTVKVYGGVPQRTDLFPAEFASEPAKQSGFGIEGGIGGLEAYCYQKGIYQHFEQQ